VTRRLAITVVVAALALPVVLDVVFGWLQTPAALVEHAVVVAVTWPAILLDRLGGLEHHPLKVQVEGLVFAGVLALAVRAIDGRQAHRAGLVLAWLIGLPLAAASAALLLVGFAMSPALFGGLLVAVLAGAGLASAPERNDSSRSTAVDEPGGPERDDPARSEALRPSRLPTHLAARAAVVLLVPLALVNGASLLASGPGDAQVPLHLLARLEGLVQPLALPWLAGAAGLVVAHLASSRPRPPRPRLVAAIGLGATLAGLGAFGSMLDADPVRQLLAALPLGAGAGACGAALASRDVPTIGLLTTDPLTSLGRLAAPLLAAALVCVWTVSTGFGGCDAVRADPRLRVLSPEPGAFAVQPSEDGVLVAFRDRGLVRRFDRDDDQPAWTLDLLNLDLPSWEGVPAPKRRAFPEELGLDPAGRFHVWVEVPEPAATRLLVLLDPDPTWWEQPDACFVSSWTWDPEGGEALAGCEWDGVLLRYRPGEPLHRTVLADRAELEEALLDPASGDLLTVGLWSTPWLRRVDLADGRTTDRRLVGGFNWGLALESRRLHLPRFHSGRLLTLDADTLAPLHSQRAGWGLRPVVAAEDRVFTASAYDGWLYAVDPTGAEQTRRLRLGGLVRDIDLSPDGRTLVAGGMCGVLEVDLARWP